MIASGPILGDVVASSEHRPRRIDGRERPDGLVRELDDARAESSRCRAALRAVRAECDRLAQRLPALEQLAFELTERLAGERLEHDEAVADLAEQLTDAEARLRDLHAQAAEAIALAEERATSALLRAGETVRGIPGGADGARERCMAAELEHLRRERAEHEERLRAELDTAHAERVELRTRLSVCEHTLADRERELARERKLADEAMHWASSVERELLASQSPGAPAAAAVVPPAGDCAVPAADAPQIAVRRRGSRVRLRTAS